MIFQNRTEAGRLLAVALKAHALDQPIVLGLPRGGVAVAAPIAQALSAPLDVLVVRKIGAPGQSELAIGAVTARGTCVWNDRVNQALALTDAEKQALMAQALAQATLRERHLRGTGASLLLRQRMVILVDDGVATGMTLQAALADVWRLEPLRVVVAVPVVPPDTYDTLRARASLVVALMVPAHFESVGQFYVDFAQVADEDVKALLDSAAIASG